MSHLRAAPILQHLHRLTAGLEDTRADVELLQRYLDDCDEAAFTGLVQRHGPMVLGVCRSVLRQHADAEDAFQATFLVLATRAGRIRRQEELASWLHGVALRVALQARTKRWRRQKHEKKVLPAPTSSPAVDWTWNEVREVLHAELAALPERLRAPLVLCYLEGLTQEEAAGRLGCSPTTVKGRIQRGRDRLRVRLQRRGLALAAALTAALTEQTLAAPVPAALRAATIHAATQVSIHAAPGSAVAVLTRIVLRQMALPKLRFITVLLLVTGAAVGGIALWPQAANPVLSTPNPDLLSPEPRRDAVGDALPEGAIARLGTLRWNHGDGLSNLCFAPDGKTLYSSGGGYLRQWDAATGKELGAFPRAIPIWDEELAFSAKSNVLISLGQETHDTFRFWDLAHHKELRQVELPTRRTLWSSSIRNALSPDGQLALINSSGQVCLCQIDPLKQLWQITRPKSDKQAVAFAGKDHVVTVDQKHVLEIREARTGKTVRTFRQEAPVEYLVASPDGRWVGTLEHAEHGEAKFLGKDVIHCWDIQSGKETHQLRARANRWFMNLLIAPDSKRLLSWSSGPDGFELTVWDAQSGVRLHEFRDVAGQYLAVSPDSTRLAAGGGWGNIALFDLHTGRRLSPEEADSPGAAAVSLSAHGERVLATGYRFITVWDVRTGKRLQLLPLPGDWSMDPYRVHSPDLRYSITITREPERAQTVATIWDLTTGKPLYTIPFPGSGVQLASAFAPDSSLLALRQPGEKPRIRFWDVRTGKELHSFAEPKADWPGHLYFTPDGKTLVVAGRRTVGYDMATGKELFSWRMEPLPDHSGMRVGVVGGGVSEPQERLAWRRLVFSSELTVAACVLDGGLDRRPVPDRLALCDARTGRMLRRWSDSGKPSNGWEELAFSPDGRLLASSDGRNIHLWEVATGKELHHFQGHRGEIRSLAFSANGRCLASASNDGTVLVWNVVAQAKGQGANAEVIAGWWADLAGDDAWRADVAFWHLTETPTATAALLRRHLRPTLEPDDKRIQQYLSDLDGPNFRRREAANRALQLLGDAAVPALREALANRPSLELRRRLERLLDRPPNVPLLPEELQRVRALYLLEQIGSVDARRLLEELAAGAAYATQTQEARAALRRLSSSHASR
jgi:RNA polymerase sigma factor (sigma-70 family)